jgi:hypothetical protein
MRRLWILPVLFSMGCSTAPVAGLMDCLRPSRLQPDGRYPDKPRLPDDGPMPPSVFPKSDERSFPLEEPVPNRPFPRY